MWKKMALGKAHRPDPPVTAARGTRKAQDATKAGKPGKGVL
jgi:hypothetical protein